MHQSTDMCSLHLTRSKIFKLIKNLKNGKSCGIDDIPNEFLKYGGNCIVNTLTDLFTFFSDKEILPDEWRQGLIKPIHKSGTVTDLDNYRGITLTSNVYKIYVHIIENVVMDHLESNKVLGENQGAFRRGRRLEDNVFTLQGVCSLRKCRGQNTYLAFLDMSKAFDRVWRDGAFYLLWKYGIKGKIWRLFREMYRHVSNKVLFGDIESEWYEQEFGLKQGCVASPTLFNVLMNELTSDLNNSGVGIEIADILINNLLFADDIVLMANNEADLKRLLDVTSNFAKRWNLKLNESKSQIMIIGKRISDRIWKIGELSLKETSQYKYLGVYIARTLKSHYHINNYIKILAENKINGLTRILNNHADVKRIEMGTSVWKSVILPSIAHGCSVWFPTTTDYNFLESVQYQAAKVIIKTRLNPPRCAVIRELGWEPIHDFLNRQRLSYFSRLQALPDSRLCKIIYTELMTLSDGARGSWNYSSYIKNLISNYDVNTDEINTICPRELQKRISSISTEKLKVECQNKSSLSYYNEYHIRNGCQAYLKDASFQQARLKLLARMNYLPLNETLHRINMMTNSMCNLCSSNSPETLGHFLLGCNYFSKEREILMSNMKETFLKIKGQAVYDLFMGLPMTGRLQLLIGDTGQYIDTETYDIFDKFGKNMLQVFWEMRHEAII